MCNSKILPSSIPCPASEALERATKRPRTEASNAAASSFDLASVFETIDNELSFPSISWDFDDEEPEKDVITMPSLGNKRDHTGLVRSKSFKTDLVTLSSSSLTLSSRLPVNIPCSKSQNSILNKLASEALKSSFKIDQLPLFDSKRDSQLVGLSRKSALPSLYKSEAETSRAA